MSGLELTEAIFDQAEISPKPVVVGLTADTSANLYQRCRESGMADVLRKPITVNEMRDYFEQKIGSFFV
jgi:CheY-like chemotaxis protein